MKLEVSIANIGTEDLAYLYQGHEYADGELLAGSVVPNVGFGSWGVEHGSTAIFGGLQPEHAETVLEITRQILHARHESGAWISGDTRPGHSPDGYLLLARGGDDDPLTPSDSPDGFERSPMTE